MLERYKYNKKRKEQIAITRKKLDKKIEKNN